MHTVFFSFVPQVDSVMGCRSYLPNGGAHDAMVFLKIYRYRNVHGQNKETRTYVVLIGFLGRNSANVFVSLGILSWECWKERQNTIRRPSLMPGTI